MNYAVCMSHMPSAGTPFIKLHTRVCFASGLFVSPYEPPVCASVSEGVCDSFTVCVRPSNTLALFLTGSQCSSLESYCRKKLQSEHSLTPSPPNTPLCVLNCVFYTRRARKKSSQTLQTLMRACAHTVARACAPLAVFFAYA